MARVLGVLGVYRICPISIGLRKAQAIAPPVVLTMSRYMFIQKGATQRHKRRADQIYSILKWRRLFLPDMQSHRSSKFYNSFSTTG